MILHVGYGFDTNDLTEKDWLNLLKTDADRYNDFCSDCREAYGTDDEETLLANVVDWIETGYGYCSEYLCGLINDREYRKTGVDNVVCCYNNFLIFENIRFIDDSPRARYIQSKEAFIELIGKYVKTDHITFGDLWAQVEDADPCCYIS